MLKRTILAMCLVAFGFAGLPAFAAGNFDLVIKNGRVMDPETGFDAVANVGINGQVVVDDSVVQNIPAGVAIRNPLLN
ncbi:hypothetical protein [Pseudomonas sp.]|uniref:hypothetical protein n=1 Tax=Pseudomonas sp. TaxID=306 RepID=UPI00299D8E07|nr:hypothetical protein [Pseudomonas sp.]MDX1370754.1 hypothetical protein [Pseudomonas sp.]